MYGPYLFYSTAINKIDKKGRVSIPMNFRVLIEQHERERSIVITPSFRGDVCLDGYGYSRIEEIAGALDKLNPGSLEYEALTMVVLSEARVLPIDNEGRVVLSEEVISLADIKDEVVFVGKGKKFQLWNRANYSAHLKDMKDFVKKRPDLLPWGSS